MDALDRHLGAWAFLQSARKPVAAKVVGAYSNINSGAAPRNPEHSLVATPHRQVAVQARGHPDTHVALTRDLVECVPIARSVEVAPADTNTIRGHLPRPLVQ